MTHTSDRPLVSIVVATYRSRPDHLSAAIASALNQRWGEIEVIISDDSPDDRLRVLVAGFRDRRLHYRHNTPALGVAENHWSSFRAARGEYIAVLNHDDWIAPRFVDRLVTALQQHPEASLAFCDHWVIDAAGRRREDETERNSRLWGRDTLADGLHRPFAHLVEKQTIPMAMGTLFRRAALPASLPADVGPAYDLWLSYVLCREGSGACYVAERLSAWRNHETNLTSAAGLPWLHGAARCWEVMAADTALAELRPRSRRKAALGYYNCAVRCWARGEPVRSLGYAVRSMRNGLTAKGLAACLLPIVPSRLAPRRWSARGEAA